MVKQTTSYMEELFILVSSCTLNYDYFVILPTDKTYLLYIISDIILN